MLPSLLQRWARQRDEELAAAEEQFAKLRADGAAAASAAAAAAEVARIAQEAKERLLALRNEKVCVCV